MILVEYVNDEVSIKLEEVKRMELIRMSRDNRYSSRSTKNISYKGLNTDQILSGRTKNLDITMVVNNYDVVLRFENFLLYLKQALTNSKAVTRYKYDNLKLSDIYNKLTNAQKKSLITSGVVLALDNSDVRVKCNCADFKYRFAFKATKLKYNLDFKETRPSSRTNPDSKGSTCKHLVGVLSSPQKYQTKVVRDVIKLVDYDNSVLDI